MKIQSFQSYNTSNTSFGLKIIDQTDGALLSAIRDVKAEDLPKVKDLMNKVTSVREGYAYLTHFTEWRDSIDVSYGSVYYLGGVLQKISWDGKFNFITILENLIKDAEKCNKIEKERQEKTGKKPVEKPQIVEDYSSEILKHEIFQ